MVAADRSGVLTVTYGDETVICDPSADFLKFNEDRVRANAMLLKADVAAATRLALQPDPKDRSVA